MINITSLSKNFLTRNDFMINPFSNENGIVPRTINQLFMDIESNKNKRSTVYCSFLQIYNEKIYDLLEVRIKYFIFSKFYSI